MKYYCRSSVHARTRDRPQADALRDGVRRMRTVHCVRLVRLARCHGAARHSVLVHKSLCTKKHQSLQFAMPPPPPLTGPPCRFVAGCRMSKFVVEHVDAVRHGIIGVTDSGLPLRG